MKTSLPILLSLNAGYVDTAGFLALHGLFTAHVTGNFVTLGAALVLGTSGILAKLLALPVFCVVILVTRVLSYALQRRGHDVFKTSLVLMTLLLATGAYMALRWGPFPDSDGVEPTLTGMVLVSAMAIQNAMHRIHLSAFPPTTLMTGTTTQMAIDLADLMHGVDAPTGAAARARLAKMSRSVLAFAVGCGLGAIFYACTGMWCFALAPLVGCVAFVASMQNAESLPGQ